MHYEKSKICKKVHLCLHLKNYVCVQSPIAFENILEETFLHRALIWYWDHLKNFIAEIPQGPLGMSIGTIWVTQRRSQGSPAKGF